MKVFTTYFEDCNGVKIKAPFLVTAASIEEAVSIVSDKMKDVKIATHMIPNNQAFSFSHCEAVNMETAGLWFN